MGEEIELEGLAQHRVVDIADAALPGSAGVGDHDVHAAEFFHDRVEGAAHRGGIRHIAGKSERGAADLFGDRFRRFLVAVEHGDFRARLAMALAVAAPIPNRRR